MPQAEDVISPMDLFEGLRKGIRDLIKAKPKATANDVLKFLDVTEELMAVIIKNLGGGKNARS